MATKVRRILILAGVFWVLLVGPALSQEKDADFSKYMQTLQNIMDDFRNFEESYVKNKNAYELTICMELYKVASTAYNHVFYLQCFFSLYRKLSNENDRNLAWQHISVCTQFANGDMDAGIKNINHFLSNTRSPAIAATGGRLRDELRKMINMLDSLK